MQKEIDQLAMAVKQVKCEHTVRQHWLYVWGKGGMRRKVPLAPTVIEGLQTYLSARGYPSEHLDAIEPGIPLIASVRAKPVIAGRTIAMGETAITSTALHQSLKQAFVGAGAQLSKTDRRAGQELSTATTHWLRHTHGTHAVRAATSLSELLAIRDPR